MRTNRWNKETTDQQWMMTLCVMLAGGFALACVIAVLVITVKQ